MNAEKIITITEPIDIDVQGITLLSVEEAEQLPEDVLAADDSWWLRSPGRDCYYAAIVHDVGYVHGYGLYVYYYLGVRPALIVNLESSNLANEDKILYRDHIWTAVLDRYLLCDDFIGTRQFRSDWRAVNANDYEASDIKKYIEDWFREVENE